MNFNTKQVNYQIWGAYTKTEVASNEIHARASEEICEFINALTYDIYESIDSMIYERGE